MSSSLEEKVEFRPIALHEGQSLVNDIWEFAPEGGSVYIGSALGKIQSGVGRRHLLALIAETHYRYGDKGVEAVLMHLFHFQGTAVEAEVVEGSKFHTEVLTGQWEGFNFE